MTKFRKWTIENLVKEAKKYSTFTDFAKGSEGAYKAYLKHGKPDEVKSIFPDVRSYWTVSSAKEEASKYSSRWDFQSGSGGAYRFLWKRGLLDDVFPRLEKNSWDEDSIREVAKECSSRYELKCKYAGAFKAAYNKGILNELFGEPKHRPDPDEDTVYIWKVAGLEDVYKIGITSRRLGTSRISFVCEKGRLSAEEIWLFYPDNARDMEEELLNKYEPYKFNRSFSGHTEFRIIPKDEVESLTKEGQHG